MTEFQRRVLDAIEAHFKASRGVSPRFRDLQLALNGANMSSVHNAVQALRREGYLMKTRTIKLRRAGITLCPVCGRRAEAHQ